MIYLPKWKFLIQFSPNYFLIHQLGAQKNGLRHPQQGWEQLAILNQENMSVDSKKENSKFSNHLLKV